MTLKYSLIWVRSVIQSVESLIDSSRRWEVARPVYKDGHLQLTHSVHYTMVAIFHNLPAAGVAREEQEVRWRTGSKDGWIKYKEASKEIGEKIKDVVKMNETEIYKVLSKGEALENKLKFKTFGKYKAKTKTKRKEKAEEYLTNLTEEERAKYLLEEQTKRIDESIKQIEKKRSSKVGKIYEIAKQAKG